MSKALKCDRCGKFFEKKTWKKSMVIANVSIM